MIDQNKLSNIFKNHKGIVAVYLFGSQVSGNTDKFSDYDFAVLFDNGFQKEQRSDKVGELFDYAFKVVGYDNADIVDLENQPLWFQQIVIKKGKVIYEKSKRKRIYYEDSLIAKCLKNGMPENNGDSKSKMRIQDVQINFDIIEENIKMLEIIKKMDYSEYTSDFRNPISAIHLLRTSIEALIDISRYIIRSLALPLAEEYWQVPTILSDYGYIDARHAETYVMMVRFRNKIVHHYYKIDQKEIYKILTDNLYDIRRWRDKLLEIID